MTKSKKWILGATALALVLAPLNSSEAALRARLTRTAALATAADCGDECPPPCVSICYRDLSRCRTCCDPCLPDIKSCVSVCDPCTGCPIKIPVCLPGCCTGDPCVSGRCTIVGRGLVRFTWCCGFSATVRFSRCGDILVTYRG